MKTTHSSPATPQWLSEPTSWAGIICLTAWRSACLVMEESLLSHLKNLLFSIFKCYKALSFVYMDNVPDLPSAVVNLKSKMCRYIVGLSSGLQEGKCHKMTRTLEEPCAALQRELCISLCLRLSETCIHLTPTPPDSDNFCILVLVFRQISNIWYSFIHWLVLHIFPGTNKH